MSSVVCLHELRRWTKKYAHACVSVCSDANARAASGDLRKVTQGSFVLHASCLKSGTVANARNGDDLDCVTLQRRSDTCPRTHRLGLKHMPLVAIWQWQGGIYITLQWRFFYVVNGDLWGFAVKGKKQHKESEQQQGGGEGGEGMTGWLWNFLWDARNCGCVLSWKVLTSVPLLPSEMQSIASQHSGLWAEKERDRKRGRGVSLRSYNVEPG